VKSWLRGAWGQVCG